MPIVLLLLFCLKNSYFFLCDHNGYRSFEDLGTFQASSIQHVIIYQLTLSRITDHYKYNVNPVGFGKGVSH